MTAGPGIVIVGAPRSGTTLLRRLLNSHENISCPGETCLLSACARFLHSERVMDGVPFGVLSGLANLDFSPEEVLGRLREFAFSFLSEHAAREGKPRWAEKTAIDAFHLDQIERLCGDAVKFVCIVRHGLDVVCSLRDLSERGQVYLSEIHEYVKQNPRPLEAFAQAWVETAKKIHSLVSRNPDNAMMLRYEDLVQDPQSEIGRVLEFVGEPAGHEPYEAGLSDSSLAGFGDWKSFSKSTIEKSSVGRWKELSKNTIAVLGPMVNPMLTVFDYETVESSPLETDDQLLRRYNMAMSLQQLKNKS